jgi:hypothetical protein
MKHLLAPTALCTAATLFLAGCGGDGCINCGGGAGTPTSYVGSTDLIAAWADPTSQTLDTAPFGEYAGKRAFIRGTVSPYTGDDLGQPAGVEIYQFSDGYIHLLDLTDIGFPSAVQVSTESHATTSLACTTNGTSAVAGASYDYQGVYFAANLALPANSTYVYRLPGTDGVCNTADDVIHAVRTGMAPTDAPLAAAAMPAATVFTAGADIAGYVAKSGTNLVMLDANLATPVTLKTYASAVGVLDALPTGQLSGYETGRLFVVDGNIVYIDYAAHTVSNSLFAIPGWTATDAGLAATAASPTGLFFATYAAGTSTVYRMPADGSAAPTVIGTVAGRVNELEFPAGSTNLFVGVAGATYSIMAMPEAGGLSTTVLLGDEPAGRFTATSADVYWTQWTATTSGTTTTRTLEKSGISAADGTVVQAALANSFFMNGGEAVPWTNADLQTRVTPLQTVFQVTGLAQTSTVTSSTGQVYVAPSLTGGTILAISTATHATVATVGTFGTTTSATALDGVVHATLGHWFFIDAQHQASTQDPATHDVYLINSQTDGSLVRGSFKL